MRVALISQNDIIGKSLLAELEREGGFECHYYSDAREVRRSDIYVIDADTVKEDAPTGDNTIRFSRMEGVVCDIKRPFDGSELIRLIRVRASVNPDIEDDYTEDDEEGYDTSELSETERRLLLLLLENKGKVVTMEEISKKVWGRDEIKSNIVNVYIRYLRQKLEKDGSRRIIFTVRGKGYRID